MAKKVPDNPIPERGETESLGLSPAVLSGRKKCNTQFWSPRIDSVIEQFDPLCDPYNPVAVQYKDIFKAKRVVKDKIITTPLTVFIVEHFKNIIHFHIRSQFKSNGSAEFNMNLYFKLETLHKTGSFHERSVIYVLHMLTKKQREGGVYTASLGNFAVALSYYGKKMGVAVTAVLPLTCHITNVHRCMQYGAKVIVIGKTLDEAKQEAINIMKDRGVGTYINGYDHPHVIAGGGTIAFEVLKQLPNVDAIIVPIGGGGLIAGIATVIKKLKPKTLIYGVEPMKSCCFFKALANEKPYTTQIYTMGTVPTAGHNAFHTARSLIDKVILVHEDWIAQAITYFAEEERYVVERIAANTLAAMFSEPNIIPELRDKTVVCIISGGNIDNITWPRSMVRADLIAGRLLSMKVALTVGDTQECAKFLRILSNLRCCISSHSMHHEWISPDDIPYMHMDVMCQTRSIAHAGIVKRVLDKLFPNRIEYSKEPVTTKMTCPCYPSIWSDD